MSTRGRKIFPHEWFCTNTCFDTAVQGDSKMAYLRMVSELVDRFMTFLCGCIDTADNNDKAALLSEIQMLKQAGKHPNIVNLVDACTQGGKLTVNHRVAMS